MALPHLLAPSRLTISVIRMTTVWQEGFFKAYNKAYRKARSWQCNMLQSSYRALRYAYRGDSGAFRTHRGQRISRIVRNEDE